MGWLSDQMPPLFLKNLRFSFRLYDLTSSDSVYDKDTASSGGDRRSKRDIRSNIRLHPWPEA